MTRLFVRGLAILLFAAGMVYAADYAVLRYRIWRGLSAYGSVTIDAYYAIQEKNGRTEYVFDSSQPQTCVNSWFPHLGCPPCWYERRHSEKQIRI
jgi:hypothetical protein